MSGPLRSLLWSGLDAVGSVLAGIVSVLVIARMIGPHAFGQGAIALGLMLIPGAVIMTLLHDGLVRDADLEDADVDAAHAAALLLSAAVGIVTIVTAGIIVLVQHGTAFAFLLVGFLPMVPFNAVSAPLMAERRRALDFRNVGRTQLIGRLVGVTFGLGAALAGAGAWSLVVQQVTTTGLFTGLLLAAVPRRPRFRPSWSRLQPMFLFSRHLVLQQFLMQGTERLFLVLVGSVHGVAAAGQWGVASRLSDSVAGTAAVPVYHVALAYFAKLQKSRAELMAALSEAQGILVFVVLPLFAGLAAAAEPLIKVALGANWAPAAPILGYLLLGSFLNLYRVLPIAALIALGQSRWSSASALTDAIVALVGAALFGWLGVLAFAILKGLMPLPGYILVVRGLSREFKLSAGREVVALVSWLVVGLVATGAARLAAGTTVVTAPVGELFLRGGVAWAVATLLVALARPRVTRTVVREAGRLLSRRSSGAAAAG